MRYASISVLTVFNIDMDEVRFALSTIEPKDMIASAASVAIIMSITNTSISVKPLLFDTGNLIHPLAKPYCKKTITPLGGGEGFSERGKNWHYLHSTNGRR